MPIKAPTVRALSKGVLLIKWVLNNGDTGTPYAVPQHTDKSIIVTGTLGAGGSVQLEGSNTPPATQDNQSPGAPNWGILHDATQSTQLVFASLSPVPVRQILENTAQIRPNCTGGDGTTAFTVELTCIERKT